MWDVVILARYRVHFILELENLVQDPSNNISIIRNILDMHALLLPALPCNIVLAE